MSRHHFLQLSDIHLRADNSPVRHADTLANLEAAIAQIEDSPIRPEAVILTGDLADRGEPAAYVTLKDRMDALAARLRAEVIYLPGNHDSRAAFRQHLLGLAGDEPIRQVHWFGDCRVVCLDTNIPGEDAGALTEADLAWLATELATAAGGGTVLALHHPPIPSPIEVMAEIALADPHRLGDVVEGTDVCLIISGHNHHATTGMLGGVQVYVAPALAYRADALISERFVGRIGSGLARIDIIDGSALVTTIPVDGVAQAAAVVTAASA
jgi:Icc protein